MTILRSLRSRLIVGSLLWTMGLLALMHMLSVVVLHMFPGSMGEMPFHWPIPLGLAFMAGGVSVLRNGLVPFKGLRERLADVRAGRDRRVAGEYPAEVQPLVDDLNELLDDREKAFHRALATAGDLAHGLKTPLAILTQEAENARDGRDAIAQQVERMRRQVDYHLARARAAASGPQPAARCLVAASVEGLVRTLLKLYASRPLEITADVAPEDVVRVQREDLDEMLGNLLDNACKWATSRIITKAVCADNMIVITVDDDGPGLPGSLRTVVMQRGKRADEEAPGSGLGLAIVRDLAELYGGRISLDDSPLGGLRAQLVLPAR